MKRLTYILLIIICSSFLYGQGTDTSSNNNLPRHFISINPINSVLLGQAGLTYEYKPHRVGFDISCGYFYPNKMELSRFFIGGRVQYGPYENYSGFFINPQINLYLSKKKKASETIYNYLSLKATYKHLKVDSTEYYVWEMFGTGGDDFHIYRKQYDMAHVVGFFFDYGHKTVSKHLFTDFNIGAGLMYHRHNIIMTGQTYYIVLHDIKNHGNIYPPRKEKFECFSFAFNLSFNIGYFY